MRPLALALALALAVVTIFATEALGAVLKVPKQYTTIQAAVDAAVAGDVISIGKGVYDETVIIDQKADLEIIGKGKKTVVRAFDHEPFLITGSQRIVLRKMRLLALLGARNGVVLGSSVECQVRACRIDSGDLNDPESIGVAVGSCTDTLVANNRIDNFHFGVMLGGGTRATVADNRITRTRVGLLPASEGGADDAALFVDNEIDGAAAPFGDPVGGIVLNAYTGLPASVFGNRVEGMPIGVKVQYTAHVLDDNTVKGADAGFVLNDADDADLTRNRACGCDVGFEVDDQTTGARLADNHSKKAASAGFRTTGTGSTYMGNASQKSKGLDLEDLSAGGNVYVGNAFSEVVVP